MGKQSALLYYIEVDGTDLSRWFRDIHIVNEDDRQDASGFNSTGTSEFVNGTRTQTINAEVFVGRAAAETQDIMYPLFRDRTVFVLRWRNTADAVSTTNPEWVGNVRLFGWDEGAARGEVEVSPVTFEAADVTGIVLTYS